MFWPAAVFSTETRIDTADVLEYVLLDALKKEKERKSHEIKVMIFE